MSTYYRIHDAGRDHSMLLDPTTWESRQYGAERWIFDTTTGEEREDVRHGVSGVDSIEGLAQYLAQSGVPMPDVPVLICYEADRADEADHDAALGVSLTWPTAIISVTPVEDDFYELVNAAYDELVA